MSFMATQARRPLTDDIVRTLKTEVRDGVYPPGARLPTEAKLCERFGVSRATVRAALKELDVLGLVRRQQGAGTFALDRPRVHDGLERMGSITDSIRASGRAPAHEYARRTLRGALPDEAERMGVAPDTEVVDVRRCITADGDVVAYSYDLIPRSVLPADLDLAGMTGSIFAYLESVLGARPTLGLATVHAVASAHIAWGDHASKHRLFVLLDQLHYDDDHRLLMYSKTYFVEGRYEFKLVRTN